MDRSKKRPPARKKIRTDRVVVGFDPEKLKAPFLLRCGALLIDYIVLVAVPVATLLLARSFGYDGAKLLNSALSTSGWLISFVLAILNFLVLPAITGQSLGKMITGIKIASKDGTAAGTGSLMLRHLVGYPLTLLTLGLGFIWAAFSPSGRALHDYIAGTVVIFGRKSITEKRYVRKSKVAAK